MERKNETFIHDTINLDEIRGILNEEVSPATSMCEKPSVDENSDVKGETEKEDDKEPKSLAYEVYGMLHDLVFILVAVTLVFVFFVRLVGVDGSSMLPTLHHGDIILLQSSALSSTEDIEYGDIVVLNVPYYWESKESLIVKRVIATGGQTVDINFDTHEVFVDGVLLDEDYINAPTALNWEGELGLDYPVTVPENHIFVLGDNRNDSSDSRFAPVGMIDVRCVLGKAWAIVLPGQTKDHYGNITDPRDWGRIGLVD